MVQRDFNRDGRPDLAIARGSLDSVWLLSSAPWVAPDSTPCADTDPCTAGETCMGGRCLGHAVTTPGGPVFGLTVGIPEGDHGRLAWSPAVPANHYDVIRGRIVPLRSRQGNFTTAIDACVADNLTGTAVDDAQLPAPSTALFYLVRATYCGLPGTYDEPGVLAPRDPTIQSAPADCP